MCTVCRSDMHADGVDMESSMHEDQPGLGVLHALVLAVTSHPQWCVFFFSIERRLATAAVQLQFSLAQWWCWRGGGEGRRAAFGQAVLETVVSEGRLEESAFRLTCSLKRWCDGVGVAAVRWHLRKVHSHVQMSNGQHA